MLRYREISVLALLPLFIAMLLPVNAVTTQYIALASFDFLSSEELSGWANQTLAGALWNTTLTSYSVANNMLNISNLDTSDAILIYPVTFNGYAEVSFGGSGIVYVVTNYNGTTAALSGYAVERTSTGITVYSVNASTKTALSSLSTTESAIVVTVQDGIFRVDTKAGTGVYQGSIGGAVIGLAAKASDGVTAQQGVFDKVALFGTMLAGQQEISLGTKTVTKAAQEASFSYDVSQYRESISAARLVVTMSTTTDPYARYYAISTTSIPDAFWQNPSGFLRFGVVAGSLTVSADVTNIVKTSPTGSFYVRISIGLDGASWSVSAKIVLDIAGTPTPTPTPGQQQQQTTELRISENTRWLLIGAGIVILIIVLFALTHGRGFGRGLAPVLGLFVLLLVIGGIAVAIMAYLHPQWLSVIALGLGAIALIVLVLLLTAGRKTIPNPFAQ